MLVLVRRREEAIVLTAGDGSQARITILYADRGRVRLGIEAPPEVIVRRAELDEGSREGRAA